MGRGLGLWPQNCDGETQGHNGRMAAGVSRVPGLLSRYAHAPAAPAPPRASLLPHVASHRPAPQGSALFLCHPHAVTGCCSTDTTHRPGHVQEMALFPESSALRTWALPGADRLSCCASRRA